MVRTKTDKVFYLFPNAIAFKVYMASMQMNI